MSIDPRIWGAKAWFIMYCVAFTFPHKPTIDDQLNIKTFYESFGSVLPCEKCKVNFMKHLEIHPLTNNELKNRKSLLEWLILINNETNKEIGSPPVTYEQIIDKYTNELDPNSIKKQTKFNYNYMYIGTIILLILFIIIKLMN